MSARRSFATVVCATGVVAAAILLGFAPVAEGDSGRSKIGCAGGGETSDLRGGHGTIAISGEGVTVVGEEPGCRYHRSLPGDAVLRHVTAREGTGTVYVADEPGPDDVVVIDEDGRRTLPGGAEVTHPTLSPSGEVAWVSDMRVIVIDDGATTQRVERPRSTSAIFSPLFTDEGDLVAVLQEEDSRPGMGEDETVNNLGRFDPTRERWKRLTRFRANGDRWSAIRTPIVLPSGDILFVRVHGRASASRAPIFELWAFHDDETRKVTRLPGEMYLAGTYGGRVAWNVLSRTCGDWELLVEGRRGLDHLACGAVMVDPVTVPDPDLEGAHPELDPDRKTGPMPAIGVVVGDFASQERAAAVAQRIGGGAEVVTNSDAPLAVRPGAYAVVVAPGRADARTLERVRDRIPGLRSKAYLAPLGR